MNHIAACLKYEQKAYKQEEIVREWVIKASDSEIKEVWKKCYTEDPERAMILAEILHRYAARYSKNQRSALPRIKNIKKEENNKINLFSSLFFPATKWEMV